MSKKRRKRAPAAATEPVYPTHDEELCAEMTLDATHAITFIEAPHVQIYLEGGGKAEFVALGFARVVTDKDGIHHIHLNAREILTA